MTLKEDHVCKVVPSRITALDFHPNSDKILICAASKYGEIGFWDMNSNPFTFRVHYEGITELKFNPIQTNLLLTSSYDGTLCCGDLKKSMFQRVLDVPDPNTTFDFLSANTYLVGHKMGNVSIVDARTDKKTSEKQHECHEYPVKCVSVHPVNKSYFLSADVKGIMRLWDLRKLQRQPLVEVHHHKKCINSAYFSTVTGNSILTTSLDDTICLFDSTNLGKSITLKKVMVHNNQTGRWLTVFKASWLPNSDNTYVVGSMQSPRCIEIFNDKMEIVYKLKDDLATITSRNVFHPFLPLVAGANSSGKVFVYTSRQY